MPLFLFVFWVYCHDPKRASSRTRCVKPIIPDDLSGSCYSAVVLHANETQKNHEVTESLPTTEWKQCEPLRLGIRDRRALHGKMSSDSYRPNVLNDGKTDATGCSCPLLLAARGPVHLHHPVRSSSQCSAIAQACLNFMPTFHWKRGLVLRRSL